MSKEAMEAAIKKICTTKDEAPYRYMVKMAWQSCEDHYSKMSDDDYAYVQCDGDVQDPMYKCIEKHYKNGVMRGLVMGRAENNAEIKNYTQSLVTNIEWRDDKINAQSRMLSKLESQLAEAKEEIEHLKGQVTLRFNNVTDLGKIVEKKMAEIQSLESKLKDAEKRIHEKHLVMEKCGDTVFSLQSQLADASKEIAELHGTIAILADKLNDRNIKNASLQSQLAEASKEIEQQKTKNNDLDTHIKSLESQLAKASIHKAHADIFQFAYSSNHDELTLLKSQLSVALEPIKEIADHGSFRGWDYMDTGHPASSLRRSFKEVVSKIESMQGGVE